MTQTPLVKAPKLQKGDTVGIISSGFRILKDSDLDEAIARVEFLGLKAHPGAAVLKQQGYFAGSDEERAQDINQMFANPNIKAILQMRGGFGTARLLELLDYELIAKNPKIVMGMSDTTALLLALYRKTSLVTFHGPNIGREWPAFTQEYVQSLLFENKATIFKNAQDKIDIIQKGQAKGRLIGGNLAVLTSIIGTPYFPDMENAILFLEEVNEPPYKIDRMFTQLKLAGVLNKLRGIVIGKFINCTLNPSTTPGAFTSMEVLSQHILPLNIPAWAGAMISHDKEMFTLPIGIEVQISADNGTIQLLENSLERK